MTTLIEGSQYALTNHQHLGVGKPSSNQSMIFVKLTDSAIKAIEDYASAIGKGNVSPNFAKPSIQIRPNSISNSSQGLLTVPTKSASSSPSSSVHNSPRSDPGKQSYNFSLKDIQNDGILECIQQNSDNVDHLESISRILLRMQIHANDDTYATTKVKMAEAAEEAKKYNTKVINTGDPNVGRKGKVNGTSSALVAKRPPSVLAKSTTSRYMNGKYTNSSASTTSQPPASAVTPPLSITQPPTHDPELVREYVIHLLALRPLKISDLLSKLQDRLKDYVDKNTVVGVLNSIAMFKDSAYHLIDSYWASEVQLDWPHYSREEREQVALKRNGANSNGSNANSSISPGFDGGSYRGHVSSPGSSTTSPPLLSSKDNGASPYNRNGTLKRNIVNGGPVAPTTNGNSINKRIKADSAVPRNGNNSRPTSAMNGFGQAHISPLYNGKDGGGSCGRSSDNESTMSNSSDSGSSLYGDRSGNRNHSMGNGNHNPYPNYKLSIPTSYDHSNQKQHNGTSNGLYNNQRHNGNYSHHNGQSNGFNGHRSGNGSGSINSTPNSSPDSGISQLAGFGGSADSVINGHATYPEEYLSKYTKITNADQYMQYKNDFNREYPIYRRLYEFVDNVCKTFNELHEMIKSKVEESDEWQELIRQTLEKYDEVKSSKYNVSRKQLQYLHHKLIHIKNLINEYTLKT